MSDKKVQDELKDAAHKIWLAGLGAMSMAEEEGSKLFKNLVEKGETYEGRAGEKYGEVRDKVGQAADKAREKAEATWDKVEERIETAMAAALRRVGVPDREQIADLTRRVEELTAAVEQLKTSGRAAPEAAD